MAKDLMSMTPEERARYHNEQRTKESTPSPQVMEQMQSQAKEAKDRKAADKAYDAASKRYAKGGYVRAADGCAQRGKTKGKML